MVSSLAHQFEWWSVDYMNIPGLGPAGDFSSWARNFNMKIRQQFPEGPRVLAGYSLGGRLALHALRAAPELYDQAILVSTNPGLIRDKDKEDRARADQQWARKFLESSWNPLLAEWNGQSVFKNSLEEPLRFEVNYARPQLAQALVDWSLSRQEDFRPLVSKQSSKILWVSGEKDIKYASIAMELKRNAPALQVEIFEKSSHRVLFDQPGELARVMIDFVQEGPT